MTTNFSPFGHEEDFMLDSTWDVAPPKGASVSESNTLMVRGLCTRYFKVKGSQIKQYQRGQVGCTVEQQNGKRMKIVCHYKRN
ncbi:hypothetical protein ACHWQZ_G019453 [Mnemiopsis leidyi]